MSAIPSVNLIAVVVAAVVAFVSGGIYWGVIANPLTKLLGRVPEQGKMPPAALIASFLTRLVVAYVLAIFLNYADAQNALAGASIALLAWIGFVLTISIGQAAFGQISWTQFIVNAGESLLGYVLMGAIIGAWA
jgi:Protein of unknown function (DUF1761)